MRTMAPPMTRAEAIKTAERMREGGWTINQIRDYLAARGQDRNRETIRRWSRPELMERSRQESMARQRKKRAPRGAVLTRPYQTYGPEFKMVRLRALVEQARISQTDAARVMALDFGDRLTEGQVRHALETGRYPKKARG